MQATDLTDGKTRSNDFLVGEWKVAPSLNLLVRDDSQVRLEPRVMDVLVHLAKRAGEVIPKEELVESVWQGRCVTDDALSVAIYSLRRSLGDDARRPRYVETVSRRGYRLVASVRPASGPSTWVQPETTQPPKSSWLRRTSWSTRAAAVTVALLGASAFWMLTVARHRRHVPSAEAHEAYLKGRHFLDQRSIQGWRQALEQFERSVALDPQDPAAQAGLADTYSEMSDFGVASPAEMRPRAMRAVQRALELDPQSAEALEAMGRAQFLFDWDFSGAERSLARAIALDPDYMPAQQATAWLMSARGKSVEAVGAARRALQLDPVNTARYTELAWVLALSGRHREALGEIERALQLNPRSSETYLMKGWTYEEAGEPDAAFTAYQEGLRLMGVPNETLQRIEAEYHAKGLEGYYRDWLTRGGGGTLMSETRRAQLFVRVGDFDRAIECLERAYQRREGALAWVNVEPSFRRLRSSARFRRIAANVGH